MRGQTQKSAEKNKSRERAIIGRMTERTEYIEICTLFFFLPCGWHHTLFTDVTPKSEWQIKRRAFCLACHGKSAAMTGIPDPVYDIVRTD